LTSLLDYFTTW